MNKQKIIWTLLAVTVSGLAAYSIFIHQSEDYQNRSRLNTCLFCSIRNSSGIVGFATGVCIVGAFHAWQKS